MSSQLTLIDTLTVPTRKIKTSIGDQWAVSSHNDVQRPPARHPQRRSTKGPLAIELVADTRDVDTSKHQRVTFRLANRGEVDIWTKPYYEVHRWTGQRWEHVSGRNFQWAAVSHQVKPGESTDPQSTPGYNPKYDYELRTSWYRIVKSASYSDPEKDTSTTLTAVAHFYLHK